MKLRARTILPLIGLIGLIGIAACGADDSADEAEPTTATSAPATTETTPATTETPSAPATTATPAPVEAVDTRLGWTPGLGGTPIAIAIDQGSWAGSAADVQAQEFATGRESLEALLGGQLDVAMLAELPAVTAALRDQEFTIVADISRYAGYRVVTTADSGIATLADLDGHKVGVTIGTNMQFMLDQIATSAGISVETVNAAPGDLVAVLGQGDIDAAVMFDSFYPRAKETLGGRYAEIPFDGYTGHIVIAVRSGFADDHPEAVQSVVDGLAVAAQLIADDPAAAQAAVVAQLGDNAPLEVVQSVWSDYDFAVDLGDDLVDLMTTEGEWVVGTGVVDGEPTRELFAGHLDDSYLTAAQAS